MTKIKNGTIDPTVWATPQDFTNGLKSKGVDVATVDDASIEKVQPQDGGGELTVSRSNELTDGGAYLFPLANSVEEDVVIVISLALTGVNPSASRQGSDNIVEDGVISTSYTFDAPEQRAYASNGVDEWRLIMSTGGAGGGVYRVRQLSLGNLIPAGSSGDIATITAPQGQIAKLTHLTSNTAGSVSLIGISNDGVDIISGATLTGNGTLTNFAIGSGMARTDFLNAASQLSNEVVGNEIIIKCGGSTQQVITYSVEFGVIE